MVFRASASALRFHSGSPALAKPSLILSASAGLANGNRSMCAAKEYFGLTRLSSDRMR